MKVSVSATWFGVILATLAYVLWKRGTVKRMVQG